MSNEQQQKRDPRLEGLIKFQSVIDEKMELCKEYDSACTRRDHYQRLIDEAQQRYDDACQAVEDNQQNIERLVQEKDQSEKRFGSLQAKINQVRTTKEYESRQKEMKVLRENTVRIETEITDHQAATADLEAKAAEAKTELDDCISANQPHVDQLESEIEKLDAAIVAKEDEEMEQKTLIPPEIMAVVEGLLEARDHRAIVPIQDECCTCCGMRVTPQTIHTAKGGLDLLQCENCSAYLYWEEPKPTTIF